MLTHPPGVSAAPGPVALLTPFAAPAVGGNAVTVERIARGLGGRGLRVATWDVAATPPARLAAEVAALRPAVVHGFHAWRVGPLALRIARHADVPLVITLTGTDVNEDLRDPGRAPTVRRVLEDAAVVVAFHESVAARVRAVVPDVAPRVVVVPQAPWLPEREPWDLGAAWPLPAERVLFVLCGGIRPVKRPRFPIAPLARVVARHPAVRLAYVGPVVDAAEGAALARELQDRPWARRLGAVPHRQIASVLEQADVVLNCSLSEGGMANAVLEAQALGRAVLASDIDGNRSLVEPGVTGLLFRDAEHFAEAAERLAADRALRSRLGASARARVLAEYPPSREIDGYLAAYQRVVGVVTR